MHNNDSSATNNRTRTSMKWDGDVVISVRSTKIVNATAVKTSGCATVTTLANCIRIEAEGGGHIEYEYSPR